MATEPRILPIHHVDTTTHIDTNDHTDTNTKHVDTPGGHVDAKQHQDIPKLHVDVVIGGGQQR
jgi:hypothetical protein